MPKRLKGVIKLAGVEFLIDSKNLLGFSAGVDSSALFFLLMERGISFDIAIVNYHTRKNSDKEVAHARKLAKKYGKKIFIKDVFLEKSNFESRARSERMAFFASVIEKEKYQNLILANQLNDRAEWFFMRLIQGGGLNSLTGFDIKEKRKNFHIIRPLFYAPREKIERFLRKNKIKHFIDKSNFDEKFLRNFVRKKFVNSLMKTHAKGISRSFDILKSESSELYKQTPFLKIELENGFIAVFQKDSEARNLHFIDIFAKELGYVMSRAQRSEAIKSRYSCILGDKIVVDSNRDYIFVAPKNARQKHDKKFREVLRKCGVAPKIRVYTAQKDLEKLIRALSASALGESLIDCEVRERARTFSPLFRSQTSQNR